MNRPRCGLDSTFGLVVAALLWLSCEPGHAQEIARVGERVRLRLADERVVGTIQTLDARSVTLGDPATGKTVAYDLGSVLGSEVQWRAKVAKAQGGPRRVNRGGRRRSFRWHCPPLRAGGCGSVAASGFRLRRAFSVPAARR